MSFSKEEVELAYRLFLDRGPESEKVLLQKCKLRSTSELRNVFLNSSEFQEYFSRFQDRKNKETREPVVIHLHLPKTAGTSFNKMLVESYKEKFAYAYHDSKKGEFTSIPNQTRENIDLMFGHMNWGIHSYLRSRYLYLFVLRQPKARIFSLFQYIKIAEDHPLHLSIKGLLFSEFLDLSRTDNNLRWAIDNAQMLRVSGSRLSALGPLPDYRVEFRNACANAISQNCEFGFLEDFSSFINRLRDKVGILKTTEDHHLNITGTGSLLNEELSKLSGTHTDLLENYVTWDQKFYDICKSFESFVHEKPKLETA